jgi:hypothetical protein
LDIPNGWLALKTLAAYPSLEKSTVDILSGDILTMPVAIEENQNAPISVSIFSLICR